MENENVIWLRADQAPHPEPAGERDSPERESAQAAAAEPAPPSAAAEDLRPPSAASSMAPADGSRDRGFRKNWAYWRKPSRRMPVIPSRPGERWKRRLPEAVR